ncbi:MAG TPA: hypothetical protein DEP70_09180 [Acholeplasmataceae bacterium]|nr:hypothetical protein [Acholeplasmataceae bacterium]
MKKLLFGISVLLLTITLAACTGTSYAAAFDFETDQEVFGFAAISTSSILENSSVQPLSQESGMTQLDTKMNSMTLEEIQPYLEMFEELLTQNQGLTVVETVSEDPLYTTKVEFTVSNLLGEPVVYTMFYNQTLKNDDAVIEEPVVDEPVVDEPVVNETEVDETDDLDDEDELEYIIEGILFIDGAEYQVYGKKEMEDGEEKLTFKSMIDENNYVESKYKTEDGETKFYITVVQNGILVSESKIKIESEDNETKIVLEYNAGLNESKYSFKLENEDGVNLLMIKYEVLNDGTLETGKIKVEVIVDELTGVTSYQLFVEPDNDDAFEHEEDRNNHSEDDDHDDDDSEDNEESEYEQEDESEDNDENEDDYSNDDVTTGATV